MNTPDGEAVDPTHEKQQQLPVPLHDGALTKPPQDNPQQQIFSLLAQILERGYGIEAVDRMLSVYQQLQAEYAEKQYNAAMSAFQYECAVLAKSKVGATTTTGRVAYRYTPYEQMVEDTRELRMKYGFSYDTAITCDERGAHILLTVHHVDGHSRTIPMNHSYVDRTGVMTQAQVESATVTYCIRRAFASAFSIATGDIDTDGAVPQQVKGVTEEQLYRIRELIPQTKYSEQGWAKAYKVDSLDKLTLTQAAHLLNRLNTETTHKDTDNG